MKNKRKVNSRYLEGCAAVCAGLMLGAASAAWAQTIPTDGLAALWEFEDGSGPTATDSSPNNNNGTIDNFLDPADNARWVEGFTGGGLAFDGQTFNRLIVPNDPSIADDLVNAFSVAFWMKSNVPLGAGGSGRAALEKGNMFFMLQGVANGGMNLLLKKGGNVTAGIGESLEAGVWYHLTGIFDGSEARVYVDGQLKNSLAVEAPIDLTDLDLVIGGDDGSRTFDGTLDTVAIWNRALTDEEVLQVAGRVGPPNITGQPQTVAGAVYEGGSAQFSVNALGEDPLSYQWYKGEDPLRSETADTLILEHLTPADSGDYWVKVSNTADEQDSVRVTLTVQPVEGLQTAEVLHHRYDETSGMTAADSSGQGNDGTLWNYFDDTHWVPGKVNNSLQFVFDNVNDFGGNVDGVADSASLDGVNHEATFSFWLKAASYGFPEDVGTFSRSANYILRKGDHFGIRLINDPGSVVETIVARGGDNADNGSIPRRGWEANAPQGLVVLDEWQHWTVLYRNNTVTFYLNGFQVGDPFEGTLGLPNDEDLAIGDYSVFPPSEVTPTTSPLNGRLDEVRIWARPLSEAEILEVAGRDVAGAPVIVEQPASQKRIEGTTATFEVAVTGKRPLTYRWMKDGETLPGETSDTLILPRLQPRDAGDYSVEVTNSEGAETSQAATLEVEALDAITSGLVAYYKFDDGPGTTLLDSSGNDLNGEINNMDDTSRVTGPIGGAFHFDGLDDYVTVPHNDLLNLGTEATVSLWLNIDGLSDGTDFDRVFRKATTFDMVLLNNGVLRLHGIGKAPYSTPANAWETAVWTHYAYVAKNGTIQWYKNGEPLGNPINGRLGELNTDPLTIANYQSPPGSISRPYMGSMDDFGIWQRALTDAEINGIFVNGSQGKPLDQEFTPLSITGIEPPPAGGGAVVIHFFSPYSDRSAQIESKTSLEAADWTVMDGATIEDNGQGNFSATVDMTGADTAFFRVVTIPPPPLFEDDFETEMPGWTHGGAGDNWQRGVPTTGPAGAYSPENVYATGLGENLREWSDAWLRTPEIDLTSVLGSATLSFAEWRNTDFLEGLPVDQQIHRVEVYVLDAATEDRILPDPIYVNSGPTTGWEVTEVRLVGAPIGQRVKIEFRVVTDNFNLLEGWYLDDVIVRQN